MSAKYSKSTLRALSIAEYPTGIEIGTRDLSKERFFTLVGCCSNNSISAVKNAVNDFLGRECRYKEDKCDSEHSNVVFYGTGYEYESICENNILVPILFDVGN